LTNHLLGLERERRVKMSDYRVSTKLTEEEYKQIEKLIGEGTKRDLKNYLRMQG